MSKTEALSVVEAARRANVPRSTLRYWIEQGEVRTTRDGRVPASELATIARLASYRQDRPGNSPGAPSMPEAGRGVVVKPIEALTPDEFAEALLDQGDRSRAALLRMVERRMTDVPEEPAFVNERALLVDVRELLEVTRLRLAFMATVQPVPRDLQTTTAAVAAALAVFADAEEADAEGL